MWRTYHSGGLFIKQLEVDILGHEVEGAEVYTEEIAGVEPVPYHRHEQCSVNSKKKNILLQ